MYNITIYSKTDDEEINKVNDRLSEVYHAMNICKITQLTMHCCLKIWIVKLNWSPVFRLGCTLFPKFIHKFICLDYWSLMVVLFKLVMGTLACGTILGDIADMEWKLRVYNLAQLVVHIPCFMCGFANEVSQLQASGTCSHASLTVTDHKPK